MRIDSIIFALGLTLCLACEIAQSDPLYPTASINSTQLVLPGTATQVDVYYPALDARFPMAIVLQGGLVSGSQYSQFGQRLARHGFVVAIPNRLAVFGPPGSPPVPFPDQLVILETLAQLESETTIESSPLRRRVDIGRLGLVGHSVGGFAGLLSIAGACQPPFCFGGSFPAIAALGAGAFYGTNTVEPTSGQVIDLATGETPIALIQGSEDGVSTSSDAEATLATLDGPRKLITVSGANHYGLTNETNPPGAAPELQPQTIPQSDSIQQIGDAAGSFLVDRMFGLNVSSVSNRSDALPLKERTLTGNAYIFLTPLAPETPIAKVNFHLDGAFVNSEWSAPYDMKGTSRLGRAVPLDTRWIRRGLHSLRADIYFASGKRTSVATTFTVSR